MSTSGCFRSKLPERRLTLNCLPAPSPPSGPSTPLSKPSPLLPRPYPTSTLARAAPAAAPLLGSGARAPPATHSHDRPGAPPPRAARGPQRRPGLSRPRSPCPGRAHLGRTKGHRPHQHPGARAAPAHSDAPAPLLRPLRVPLLPLPLPSLVPPPALTVGPGALRGGPSAGTILRRADTPRQPRRRLRATARPRSPPCCSCRSQSPCARRALTANQQGPDRRRRRSPSTGRGGAGTGQSPPQTLAARANQRAGRQRLASTR